MVTSIHRFLAYSTGPAKLRTDLSHTTAVLKIAINSLKGMNSVRSEIPLSVLGGDIFNLFGKRLYKLIQSPELPGDATDIMRSNKTWSADDIDPRIDTPTKKLLSNTVRPDNPSSSLEAQPANYQSEREPFVPEKQNLKERKSGKNPEIPVLERKLDEYWQLTADGQSMEGSRKSLNSEMLKDRDSSNIHSLSFPQPMKRASWPEKTGNQVAQKIHSLEKEHGTSVSNRHIDQSANTHLPDKVEIQNIFNIDVKGSDASGRGSLRDLSRNISDILRQQAMQHGIDIT